MPNNLLLSLSKRFDVSTSALEKLWLKAKKAADSKPSSPKYALINTIFRKMAHKHLGVPLPESAVDSVELIERINRAMREDAAKLIRQGRQFVGKLKASSGLASAGAELRRAAISPGGAARLNVGKPEQTVPTLASMSARLRVVAQDLIEGDHAGAMMKVLRESDMPLDRGAMFMSTLIYLLKKQHPAFGTSADASFGTRSMSGATVASLVRLAIRVAKLAPDDMIYASTGLVPHTVAKDKYGQFQHEPKLGEGVLTWAAGAIENKVSSWVQGFQKTLAQLQARWSSVKAANEGGAALWRGLITGTVSEFYKLSVAKMMEFGWPRSVANFLGAISLVTTPIDAILSTIQKFTGLSSVASAAIPGADDVEVTVKNLFKWGGKGYQLILGGQRTVEKSIENALKWYFRRQHESFSVTDSLVALQLGLPAEEISNWLIG